MIIHFLLYQFVCRLLSEWNLLQCCG